MSTSHGHEEDASFAEFRRKIRAAEVLVRIIRAVDDANSI